jgi:integrase
MVRSHGRLTSLAVERARKPGLYADGGGLYLQVSGVRGRSWIFRFMIRGKARSMGLGSFPSVPLAAARAAASECRRELQAGIDPITAREARKVEGQLAEARGVTFKACCEAYIKDNKSQWRNARHLQQWQNSLSTYAYPILGPLPVQKVDAPLIRQVLAPIWEAKSATASRLRGRLESVLDYATALEYRKGDNPARWRGNLENTLPKPSKLAPVEHHAALPYTEIGEFIAELRAQEGVPARALEFAILTAARTGEVLGAQTAEFDLSAGMWKIPAARIKGGREHRIPLSKPAAAIVADMIKVHGGTFVFPGSRYGRPPYPGAILKLLKRMGRDGITVHGFRSTFRDWAGEMSGFAREVVERSLAHVMGDKTEASYARGDLLEKRRRLMDEWAQYCSAPFAGGKVLPLRRSSE